MSGGCGKERGRKGGGGGGGECSLKEVTGQPAEGSWRWAELEAPTAFLLMSPFSCRDSRHRRRRTRRGRGSSQSGMQQSGQAASDGERALGAGVGGRRWGGGGNATVGGPSNPWDRKETQGESHHLRKAPALAMAGCIFVAT